MQASRGLLAPGIMDLIKAQAAMMVREDFLILAKTMEQVIGTTIIIMMEITTEIMTATTHGTMILMDLAAVFHHLQFLNH